jgi:hypothetical protein
MNRAGKNGHGKKIHRKEKMVPLQNPESQNLEH